VHEQERYEYVPTAHNTLDADQLMLQQSTGLQDAGSSYTHEQQQQVAQAERSQLSAGPASKTSLCENAPQRSSPAETLLAEGAATLASVPHAGALSGAAVSAVACTYEVSGVRQKVPIPASTAPGNQYRHCLGAPPS
jgi:hypothetical protein